MTRESWLVGFATVAAAIGALAFYTYRGTRTAVSSEPVISRPPAQTAQLPIPEPAARRASTFVDGRQGESTQRAAANASAREERERTLTRIRDDHVGHEDWQDTGLAIIHDLDRGAVRSADEGCYMAGCVATLTFQSDDAFQETRDALATDTRYTGWTGDKKWTSPEVSVNGETISTIVLQRPN